jgi:hypothetical protein
MRHSSAGWSESSFLKEFSFQEGDIFLQGLKYFTKMLIFFDKFLLIFFASIFGFFGSSLNISSSSSKIYSTPRVTRRRKLGKERERGGGGEHT